MFQRDAQKTLLALSRSSPVLAILGPRQSGKTTLVRSTFSDWPYVSLETPEKQEYALSDPKGFLSEYPEGAIIDEVQRVPELLSYIQGIVDEEKKMGFFILTGSQQFNLSEKINQSLAGRVAFLDLLPMTCRELNQAGELPKDLWTTLFQGGYPAIYDRKMDPIQMYDDYIRTYVERDVRQITSIQNLSLFQTFLGLCAGRVGSILDVTSLANDTGISPHTAESWLSVLEASYVIFRLQPHFKNFSKRLIKRPKLYFTDTGLASRLIGIRSPEELRIHSLRGGLFESFVVSEIRKHIANQRLGLKTYYWRDHKGEEIDLILDLGSKLLPIEIKSSQTISNSLFDPIKKFKKVAGKFAAPAILIYGGKEQTQRSGVPVLSWQETDKIEVLKKK